MRKSSQNQIDFGICLKFILLVAEFDQSYVQVLSILFRQLE